MVIENVENRFSGLPLGVILLKNIHFGIHRCRMPCVLVFRKVADFSHSSTETSTPIHARAWKENALAGYNSQQIPTENDIHKMLIIIILLRWKHFVIKSYLYKITTNTLIFSQLNFTHRWLSIVFHIEFEELHKADKSIVEH